MFSVEPFCGTLLRVLIPAQKWALSSSIHMVTRCSELVFLLTTSSHRPNSLYTAGTRNAFHPEILKVSQKELIKLCPCEINWAVQRVQPREE